MTETMTAQEYRTNFVKTWRKYRNIPTSIGGERFDSRKEGRRHVVHLDRQKRGEIEKLERQVSFRMNVAGMHICTLIVDWTYIEAGRVVAEDCKSPATAKERSFRIKWKLAKALYPLIDWRLS